MTTKKWIIVSALISLSVILFAIFYALPYIALYNMRLAFQSGDAEDISSYIDFVTLRSNLKDQFKAEMRKKMENDERMRNNPFAGFAYAMANPLIDSMVDTTVTPKSLETFIQNRVNREREAANTEAPKEQTQVESFWDKTEFEYKFPSKFIIKIKVDDKKDMKLILTRNGFDWKLTDMKLPVKGD